MQINYHSGNVLYSLYSFRGDTDKEKSIQLMTELLDIFEDSKLDWNYYCVFF